MSNVTSYATFRRLIGEEEVRKLAEEMGMDSRALLGKHRIALREALLRQRPPRKRRSRNSPSQGTESPQQRGT